MLTEINVQARGRMAICNGWSGCNGWLVGTLPAVRVVNPYANSKSPLTED
ncbi:hypothetical protein NIES4071_67410 [Calothrix sp. NIES-4071]|nr:hypothetical protein NIES4071_67410 [Calothrix sp. NIES-4071]BAZ61019.1 hypothetical protein NIES4105_67370 [Calothrix sp. NIES-4105]